MIRVVLVDDQMLVRQGVRGLLELLPDIEVVGEAGDGEAALTLLRTLMPRVILMDLRMPRLDGFMATAACRALTPTCAVIVLSLHDDSATRGRAEAAGAAAFVSKREPCNALVTAIRRASA